MLEYFSVQAVKSLKIFDFLIDIFRRSIYDLFRNEGVPNRRFGYALYYHFEMGEDTCPRN